MTIKEYLRNVANELVSSFPELTLRISYNSLSKIYFIEVMPATAYNDNLKVTFSSVVDDFYNNFPLEDLSIVTNEDLIDLMDDDIFIKGDDFQAMWAVWLNREMVCCKDPEPINEHGYTLAA